jgi:hypothetical protein
MLRVVLHRADLGPNVVARYDHELQAIADIGLTDIAMDSTRLP